MPLPAEFVAAAIGAATTYLAVFTAESLARKREQDAESKRIRQLVMALRDEIETLWDLYLKTIGEKLLAKQNGQPFAYIWPIEGDYFVVYRTSAMHISSIESDSLRSAIVKFYTRAAGHIDSLKYNNQLLDKVSRLAEQYGGERLVEDWPEFKQLIAYGDVVKEEVRQLVRDRNNLSELFESYLKPFSERA